MNEPTLAIRCADGEWLPVPDLREALRSLAQAVNAIDDVLLLPHSPNRAPQIKKVQDELAYRAEKVSRMAAALGIVEGRS